MRIWGNEYGAEIIHYKGRKFYLWDFEPCDYKFEHKGKTITATHCLIKGDVMYLLVRSSANSDTCKLYTKQF